MLLSVTKGGNRIDNVWGSGGGQQSVKHLVKEVADFYKSLLSRVYSLKLILFGMEQRNTHILQLNDVWCHLLKKCSYFSLFYTK